MQFNNPPRKIKNMTALHLKQLISGSPLRLGLFLFTLALACFALSPSGQAVSPPPDGGYALNNTAEGENALLNLNLGVGFGGGNNTALGALALQADIKGSNNTAIGAFALLNNTNHDNTAIGVEALKANTQGQDNTAIGVSALANNTGSNNVALGAVAGNHLTTGSKSATSRSTRCCSTSSSKSTGQCSSRKQPSCS
jgi:hypothetical protein